MEPAAAACPSCGAPAAADARFCSRCGAALTPARVAETRRVVTALFADVVGSTALGERMDPEDFRAVMDAAVGRMVSAVEGLGGSVEHLAGDGLLALFGAPVAHEDDPERAVLAGLRIVSEIGHYGAQAAAEYSIPRPAVRVGIETGLAVVGPVAAGGQMRLAATGDALNTAARLQAAARPGTVLVGARSRAIVEPLFRWGERHDLRLKGKGATVTAIEVLAPRAPAAVTVPPRAEAAFVGRERELAVAQDRLRAATAGTGGVLLVSGEPGMGKSRLLRELSVGEDRGAVLWLAGRCVSYGHSLPYHPFRGLLGDWLGDPPRGPGVDPAALAPIISPAEMTGLGRDPSEVKRRAFDAVRALLQRRARDGPVVVAIDDVHWVDGSSAALVEHLVPATADSALLVVLAGRSEEEGPAADLRRAARSHAPDRTAELRLEPLPADADRDLLTALVGPGTLPADLERRVLDRAEGNPFFLEELVESLLQAGALERRGERLRFVAGVDVEVPETVERLVLARIDRLAPGSREILSAASVLGRRFPLPLLRAVLHGEEGLDGELRELRRHDLLRAGDGPAEDQYRFKHSLIQETAYRSLLRRRRRELHSRAAVALEQLAPDRHGLLAHHYSAAGRHDQALERHARAAEAAFGVYSLDEAREHVDGAIAAGERLGVGADDARVRELLCLRGTIRFYRGDLHGGAADAEAALEAARAAGDRRVAMRALVDLCHLRHRGVDRALEYGEEALRIAESLGDTDATVLSLSRVSILLANRLRLDLALEHAERALRLAEEADDEWLVGRALDALKLVALELGDLALLEATSDRAARIHRGRDDRFYLAFALLEGAFVPLARADFGAARERLDVALALNAEVGDRSSRPLFLDTLCWLERSRGSYDRALAAGFEGHRLARAAGSRDFVAWSTASLGWTLLEVGRPEHAAEILSEGLAVVEGTGAGLQLVRCGGLLASAEAALGHRARAAELAGQVEDLLGRVTAPPGGTFLYGAHALLAVARVRLYAGDPAAAERIAAPLLAAADRVGWLETRVEAACVVALCRHARGDAAEGESVLRRALGVAADAALPGAERQARSALAALLAETGRTAEARDHERRAAALDPRPVAAAAELGGGAGG